MKTYRHNRGGQRPSLDVTAAERMLKRHVDFLRRTRKRRGDLLDRKIEDAVKLMTFWYENYDPDLQRDYVFSFPNERSSDGTGLSLSRVEALKKFLREAGVMFIVSGSRPQRKWHRGFWLLSHKCIRYVQDIVTVELKRRPRRISTLKWNKLYRSLVKSAHYEASRVAAMLTGDYREHLRVEHYMSIYWDKFRQLKARNGWTDDDLAWNPPSPKLEHVAKLRVVGDFGIKASEDFVWMPSQSAA